MKKELKDPVLFQFYLEGSDRSWLKTEAKKKKLSIAGLIRYYLQFFRKQK